MKKEVVPTKEKLAKAIEAEMTRHFYKEPIVDMFKVVIDRARAGLYDDYESGLAMPQMELINSIRALNVMTRGKLDSFLNRVKSGEFDATQEESDAWWEREGRQIAKEEGLQGLFERLPDER